MQRRKPLEETGNANGIEDFSARMGKLGFTFRPTGKPETLELETIRTGFHPEIRDLTDDSIASIEVFLEEREADGGLIINVDRRSEGGITMQPLLLVTLLAYKLIPKTSE